VSLEVQVPLHYLVEKWVSQEQKVTFDLAVKHEAEELESLMYLVEAGVSKELEVVVNSEEAPELLWFVEAVIKMALL